MAAALSSKARCGFAQQRTTRPRVASRRAVKVCAKYGESSRYFDLQDMENTTGAWDMYGQDDDKRYPSLQNDFFERYADIVSRRAALRTFVAGAGLAAFVTYGVKGAKDANLPITKGPQTSGENGKGGSVSSRL